MNLSTTVISAVLSGAVASGIIVTIILLLLSKIIKKSKQSNLAKELKNDKELEFIKANIKQINSQLQLETTSIAKSLDSFNNDEEKDEVFKNTIISQRASRKELTEKDKKKATKVKI
ncbi:hypothetical protein [Spiroplasma ixodetis]|uniref:hypothetical protein n=1 Tax=Spiroplasma ixodetis TaxID=2141 RepID=UPI0025780034|nr:hypothetical protein [Spiroplasma ixodetis]WJG70736.1 hypothetical protein SIXOD_v1c19550 [Spiroplasma ixodetis Y32]WJG71175.1 hypothetical protein SIXOD_v1c25360 [Spiroplasma ixodetis Y32]